MSCARVRTPSAGGLLSILLCLSFLAPVYAFAQQGDATIRGVVTDAETGRPIAGALISLDSLDRSTLTGPDGRFLLAGLPPGEADLTVEMLGYARLSDVWVIRDGAMVEVELEPAAIELEELVVDIETIERIFEDRRRAATTSVLRLREEELERSSWINLRQLLQSRIGIVMCPQFGMAPNPAAGSLSSSLISAAAGFPACVVARGRTMPIAVYIDEHYSLGGVDLLEIYHPREIYSIEIRRGGSEIRVFTRQFIRRTQRGNATLLRPRPIPPPGGPGG